MRSIAALATLLLISTSVFAQVPPEVIEGPLTIDNTTEAGLSVLFDLGMLRHADGSLPHTDDPVFGDDFFAVGPDCINLAGAQVWHWHRFDIDGFVGCGHGAVIIAQENGGGNGVPELFAPGFAFGEVTQGAIDGLFANPPVFERARADVHAPLGRLDFGRMASHWGMGIFGNDGNRVDWLVAENESPRPKDRLLFIYDYFGNGAGSTVPGEIPMIQPPGTGLNPTIERFIPGFEKTFLDGLNSHEIRVPFAPSIAVDPETKSVVVTYTQFNANGIAQSFVQFSDGGGTVRGVTVENSQIDEKGVPHSFVQHSLDGGATWGPPSPIEAGVRIDTGVTFDREGRILTYSSIFDEVKGFELNIRGINGADSLNLGGPNGTPGPHFQFQPSVAVDPTTGNVGAVWKDARPGVPPTIQFGTCQDQRWGDYSAIGADLGGNSVDPHLIFSADGKPLVTFSNNSGGNYNPFVFQREGGIWKPLPGDGPNGAIVDTPGQSRDPQTHIAKQGQLYVVWTETTDTATGGQILGQTHDGSEWRTFDPFSNGPSEFPGGTVPPDTQDFYRYESPGGAIRFLGVGPDGTFNGSITMPPQIFGGANQADDWVMDGVGPDGLVTDTLGGDAPILITGGEPHHADDDVYSLEHAVDKMVKKISGPLAGPDQETMKKLIVDAFKGLKGTDGTPGKTLEDAAKDAVDKNKDALKKNPDARKVYDGLQDKAKKDAKSSDKHDAAKGRQWQRILDAIGKAAGWPTSGAGGVK